MNRRGWHFQEAADILDGVESMRAQIASRGDVSPLTALLEATTALAHALLATASEDVVTAASVIDDDRNSFDAAANYP